MAASKAKPAVVNSASKRQSNLPDKLKLLEAVFYSISTTLG